MTTNRSLIVGSLFFALLASLGLAQSAVGALQPEPISGTFTFSTEPATEIGDAAVLYRDEVPCDQIMADGSVYCGEPGSEGVEAAPQGSYNGVPLPVENKSVTVVIDGYPVTTGEAELAEETDEEYQARLGIQYCEVKPWVCEG